MIVSFKLFKTKQQASSEGSSMPSVRTTTAKSEKIRRRRTRELHKRLFSGCADGGERSRCYISAGVTLSPAETPDFSIKPQQAGHSTERV